MAVVKANAYGHGAIPVAKKLEQLDLVHSFGVALLQEAIELRKAQITKPILVFGGFEVNQIPYHFKYDLEFTISSIEKLEQIQEVSKEFKKPALAHLKIDTGMGRIGVRPSSAQALIEKALKAQEQKHIVLKGIYSHFASAQDKKAPQNLLQIETFEEVCHYFTKIKAPMPLRHMANSGAILNYPQSSFDLVRPGLSLYGVSPLPLGENSPVELRAAMELLSTIVYFKAVLPGQGISYDSTWKAKELSRVITVPLGYADGIPASLSNRGRVFIGPWAFPIIGKVCMDQFMALVEKEAKAFNGDVVEIIGPHQSAEQLAHDAQVSVYELLVRIPDRVPRLYIPN